MNRAAIFVFILITFGLQPFKLCGQQNDFQAWPSFQVNLEVIDNLKLHLEEEIRFHEDLSLVNRQVNDLGITYRINKYLKTGVFYRLEADWKNAGEYAWRNGIYSDISLRYEVERFTLGYRLRVQSSRVERNDSEGDLFDGFRHRHKLSAEYDLKGIPLVPFAEAELFVDYSAAELSRIKGFRTWFGLEYSIKKIHKLCLKYGIDQEINTSDPLRSYIIALGYALDLKL